MQERMPGPDIVVLRRYAEAGLLSNSDNVF